MEDTEKQKWSREGGRDWTNNREFQASFSIADAFPNFNREDFVFFSKDQQNAEIDDRTLRQPIVPGSSTNKGLFVC